jgi:hypothetical protein
MLTAQHFEVFAVRHRIEAENVEPREVNSGRSGDLFNWKRRGRELAVEHSSADPR